MKHWVKVTDTLTVDPELIAAVVVLPVVGGDKAVVLVPVMANDRSQWLHVENVERPVVSTFTTQEVWRGEPMEQTHFVREDNATYEARVQERVATITALLGPK